MGEEAMAWAGKSRQDLGLEGQKHLEETVEAAFQILSSMNDELCNPDLWSTAVAHPHPNEDAPGDHHSPHEGGGGYGGGALEEARLRYKSAVSALRAVIAAVPSSPEELVVKNKQFKLLLDQLRELITDISTWQSPCSS